MINIDNETGALKLHRSFMNKIEQSTKLDEVKRALPSWEQTERADGRIILKIKAESYERHETLHLLLNFNRTKLDFVELYFTGDFLGDFRTQWSKAREIRRRKYHKSLFSSVLGKHKWGSVESIYDSNEKLSYVRVKYA